MDNYTFERVVNYGKVEGQTVISINTMNGDIFGISSGDKPLAKDFYRDLFVYLESKRVLFNPGAVEQREHCIASVLEMKQTLSNSIMGKLFTDKELQPIRDMIAACNKYLDKVGVPDDRRFLINEDSWEWFDMSPNGALGSLRTGFRAAIQSVEKDYALKYGKDIR